METIVYLKTLGIMPSLSARPATALLVLSVAITFGWVVGPVWLVGTLPIVLLLLITLAEWNVGKEVAIMELLETVMPFVKVVLAIIISQAMLETESAEMLTVLLSEETAAIPWWAEAINWLWSAFIGVLTWYASLYRQSYLFFISEFDEDNDLGLLSLYTWMEGLFTAGNILLALIAPIAAIILFALTVLTLHLLRRYLNRQEEKKRIPCTNNCGTLIYGTALSCPKCQTKNSTPLKVGLLGQTTSKYVTNRQSHHWELMAQKRCPRCATRFRGRDMHHICEECGESVLGSPEAVKEYVQYFEAKLPKTLVVSGFLGLVPFAGIILGVVYYRLNLISPMRRYVPVTQGCLGRWGTRLINLVLLTFQPIPVLGAFMLPLMCYISFTIYRRLMVKSQLRSIDSKKPIQKLA